MDQFLPKKIVEILNESELGRMLIKLKRNQGKDGTQWNTEGGGDDELPKTFGKFEILSELGQGGMGRVFLANDNQTKRKIALKIIRPDLQARDDDSIVSRFHLEARAAAQVQHENVVNVYEAGEYEGRPYYSMQFIAGESLEARLKKEGQLSSRESARIISQIAKGLAKIHHHKLLHRDVKPSNILLDMEGTALLADFGLAKWTEGNSVMVEETKAGAIIGTLNYMSPEQINGSTALCESSDVYSLGAVLYQCLVGVPPFQSNDQLKTMRLINESLPVAPSKKLGIVSKDIETIALKCLEKNVSERYSSAMELSKDLERFLNHYPILAKRAGVSKKIKFWAKRNRATAWLLAVISMMMLVGVLAFGYSKRQANQSEAKILIDSLLDARSSQIPIYIARLDRRRISVDAFDGYTSENSQFRKELALLPVEPHRLKNVAELLSTVSLEEFRALLQVVELRGESFETDRLIRILKSRDDALLQKAILIAQHHHEDTFFETNSKQVLDSLLAVNIAQVSIWAENLLPVSNKLTPLLFARLEVEQKKNRSHKIAICLAVLNQKNLENLLRLLTVVPSEYLPSLWPYYLPLKNEFEERLSDSQHSGEYKKFNYALAKLKFFDTESTWEAVGDWKRNGLQIPLANLIAKSGIGFDKVASILYSAKNPDQIFGALLAIEGFDFTLISVDLRNNLEKRVCELVQHHDSGIHSAAIWILKTKFSKLRSMPNQPATNSKNQWRYVFGDHLMVQVYPPGEIRYPSREGTGPENVFELRPFEIGAFEVTSGQFREFLQETNDFPIKADHSSDPNIPVSQVSYVTGARFCNWLTEKAGYGQNEFCYEIVSDRKVNRFEDYDRRKGFRLPSEIEWEFVSSQGGGEEYFKTDGLNVLDKFAWHYLNTRQGMEKLQIVGKLRPNRLGAFDMFGNVEEVVERKHQIGYRTVSCAKGGHCMLVDQQFSSDRQALSASDVGGKMSGLRVARLLFSE